MKHCGRLLAVILVTVCVLGPGVPDAHATTIGFAATDLADVVAGEDLWMYEYFVSDFVFDIDQGFSVYFDVTLYSDLESPPPPVSADWDVLTVQPDPGLPSDGIYDALALVPGASLDDPFLLTFVWLGGPSRSPGSQRFTINEFDSAGSLSFIEVGETASIPEPSMLLLVGAGTGLAIRRSRTRKRA
jgi:hypothetical protein